MQTVKKRQQVYPCNQHAVHTPAADIYPVPDGIATRQHHHTSCHTAHIGSYSAVTIEGIAVASRSRFSRTAENGVICRAHNLQICQI